MKDASFLQHLLIYLASAVIVVPLAKRSGLGSVLGQLIAGLLIGPSGFRLVASEEDVLHFAEFGVVIMLFLVGLEMAPQRLWQLRGPIFGMGTLQVVVTTLLVTVVGRSFPVTIPVALVAAMGLSLSSTAIALQIFAERNQLGTPAGRAGFAILLFQDLAVIPMLALLPLFSPMAAAAGFDWLGAGKAAVVIAGIIFVRVRRRAFLRRRCGWVSLVRGCRGAG